MESQTAIDTPKPEKRSVGGVWLSSVPTAERIAAVTTAAPMQRILFRLADAACSLVAFFLAYGTLPWAKDIAAGTLLYFSKISAMLSPASAGADLPSRGELSWVCVVVTLAMASTLEYAGDERPLLARTGWRIVRFLLLAMGVALGAVATVFFTLRVPPYSRLFVCDDIAILFALAVAYRLAVRAVQSRRHQSGAGAARVVIAGRPEGIERFLSLLSKSCDTHGVRIAGCLLTDQHSGQLSLDVPVLGNTGDLGDILIHHPIDEVVVILPDGEAGWLPAMVEHCDYFRVGIEIIHESMMDVDLRDLRHLNQRRPVPSIRLIPEEELISPMLLWKRTLDIALSFTALVVLAPLMAAIAIAIKITTPHLPVFYRWNVVGYRGRRFTGYKFTTMVADADQRKAELATLNEMSGPVFKIRNDPRITPLGRFLRKYSLNELPQFWSVLKGDMSLVGPRPAGPHELVRYEMWHKRKLSVQPGITCYWQVRGRNIISSFDDWVRMDLEYIQKRCLWTDMTILFRTVSTVIRGTGC
jgi:exopolysaccharide biosynthesis polyprenyl glycosylphosphotransferase